MEPDGSSGTLPRPALHAESENQTAGHRDQEEEPGVSLRGDSRPRLSGECSSVGFGFLGFNGERGFAPRTAEGGCPHVVLLLCYSSLSRSTLTRHGVRTRTCFTL